MLANFGVCDLLLRLAEPPRLYLPRWSAAILDEVRRTQTEKLNWPVALADSWRREVDRHFPEAVIASYDSLIPSLTNDPKDRHVLAAAVKGGVSLIVTFNLRHFPFAALQPLNVEVLHPQDYLLALYSMNAPVVMAKLARIAFEDSIEIQDALIRLGKSVPRFATQVLANLGENNKSESQNR